MPQGSVSEGQPPFLLNLFRWVAQARQDIQPLRAFGQLHQPFHHGVYRTFKIADKWRHHGYFLCSPVSPLIDKLIEWRLGHSPFSPRQTANKNGARSLAWFEVRRHRTPVA
jgi:hypothetical protein